jgi:Cu+-exporting ATPase
MEQLLQVEEKTCHHCGDECDDSIEEQGHYYCCYGCRAVHELLTNADLSNHYATTSQTNHSLAQIRAEKKFAFLDNEDIVTQLLSFENDGIAVVKFHLPGIHCSSCIYLLEHLPKLEPGILRSEVHFTRHQITITFQRVALKKSSPAEKLW